MLPVSDTNPRTILLSSVTLVSKIHLKYFNFKNLTPKSETMKFVNEQEGVIKFEVFFVFTMNEKGGLLSRYRSTSLFTHEPF